MAVVVLVFDLSRSIATTYPTVRCCVLPSAGLATYKRKRLVLAYTLVQSRVSSTAALCCTRPPKGASSTNTRRFILSSAARCPLTARRVGPLHRPNPLALRSSVPLLGRGRPSAPTSAPPSTRPAHNSTRTRHNAALVQSSVVYYECMHERLCGFPRRMRVREVACAWGYSTAPPALHT